jgi:hypothetical protein
MSASHWRSAGLGWRRGVDRDAGGRFCVVTVDFGGRQVDFATRKMFLGGTLGTKSQMIMWDDPVSHFQASD